MSLELLAIRWLRFEKRCRVAMMERSPRNNHGRPDVIGITDSGFIVEIEVKRSVSDFHANAKKPHIASRSLIDCEMAPRQFWYLAPSELADKIRPEIPTWAGLLKGPGKGDVYQIQSLVKAPTNKLSRRLTVREKIRLAQCMANQILSNFEVIDNFKHRFSESYEPYFWHPQI